MVIINDLCSYLLGHGSLTTTYKGDNIKLKWLDKDFKTLTNIVIKDQMVIYS